MDPFEPGGPDRIVVLVPAGPVGIESVEYGLSAARDAAAETDRRVSVLVLQVGSDDGVDHEGSLEARFAGSETTSGVDVRFERVQRGEAASTEPIASVLPTDHLARVVVDPRLDVSVEELRTRFGTTTVEVAPVERAHPRRRLVHPGGLRRLVALFGLTYGFYLAIGGFAGGIDLVTGAVSAAVVSLSLSHVALREEPTLARSGPRILRFLVFLPWLLWEIVRANVAIAAVILHPGLPIDPSVSTYETETREALERMVLANAITLTPGTLVLDVRERTFTVHALTEAARVDLRGGRLARLVSWVFHGRSSPGQAGGDAG